MGVVATDERYHTKFQGSKTHIAQGVNPLFTRLREGMLGFAMVEKDNVAGVAQALDAFSEARKEVVVTPSAWIRGRKIWADVRNGFTQIVDFLLPRAAPAASSVAENGGIPSLEVFLDRIQN